MCKWLKSGENRIDPCLRETIKKLQQSGVTTLASCCGHEKYGPTLIIKKPDGSIQEYYRNLPIPRTRNFYRRDGEGIYYIPEVEMFRWEMEYNLLHRPFALR